MKILVLSDFYPPYYLGGYELQCENQVEELRQRGHEVVVLTSRWQAEKGTTENVRRLLENRHFGRKHPAVDFMEGIGGPPNLTQRVAQLTWSGAARRNEDITRKEIARTRPDVIFAWNLHSVGFTPLLAAQQADAPLVVNLYDYWLADLKKEFDLESSALKRAYRRLVEGGDFGEIDFEHLLVCSEAVSATYQKLGFAGQAISVIPLGLPDELILPPDDLSETAPDDGTIRLIFVGRLESSKGVEVGIDSLALLAEEMGAQNVYLDIAGTGPDRYVDELRRYAAERVPGDRVTFLGRLDRDEVLRRYADYDALLFPSLWVEPFGLTVIEAMARGLPVIATNHGGPSEIITDGADGLLVPPGDPAALARAVQRLAAEPEMAQQMRRRALATVRENYALTEVVDRVEAYLQAVVDA